MVLRRWTHSEAYFLVQLVGDVLNNHGEPLTRLMEAARGTTWLADFHAVGADYRQRFDHQVHVTAQAAAAVADHARHAAELSTWREYMVGVAALSQDPVTRQLLRRAVGLGRPTPRSRPAVKDFLDHVAPATAAYAASFRRLGANEESIARPEQARAEEQAAWTRVGDLKAAATKARGDVRIGYAAVSIALDEVFRAADLAAVEARLLKDDAKMLRADSLVARLEQALRTAAGKAG